MLQRHWPRIMPSFMTSTISKSSVTFQQGNASFSCLSSLIQAFQIVEICYSKLSRFYLQQRPKIPLTKMPTHSEILTVVHFKKYTYFWPWSAKYLKLELSIFLIQTAPFSSYVHCNRTFSYSRVKPCICDKLRFTHRIYNNVTAQNVNEIKKVKQNVKK